MGSKNNKDILLTPTKYKLQFLKSDVTKKSMFDKVLYIAYTV